MSRLLAAAAMAVSAAPWASADTDPASNLREPLPDRWLDYEHFNQQLPSDDLWWRHFDDRVLDSLISVGIDNNYDVLMAARRIEIARQQLNMARSGYFPTLDFSGGWTRSRSSGMTGPVASDAATASYFQLGINMSWEIDVFGKIASKARQKKELYNASRAEFAAGMITLCANIAKAYIDLRVYQQQWQVATEHIASQEKILRITEARYDAGLASMLDVTQARVVYNTTLSTMPGLESAIHTTINSIAVMVGRYPDDLYALLERPAPMPECRQIVPVGVPADILRRRPDIVAAEYQLAAAAAEVGIARKDFLPTLSLNGSIGTAAHDAGDLFSHRSLTYTIAPTLTWNIFSGLARRYNVVAAREQMESQIESYNLTVLNAVKEVDGCISVYESTIRTMEMIQRVIDESRKALDLSLDLYKRGLSPFNNVVTAQMDLLSNQNSLVAAQGKALAAHVALYEALGGGWDQTLPVK